MMIRAITLTLALPALSMAASASAAVIGHITPSESVTAERIANAPVATRSAWNAYLQRSQARMATDKKALAEERKGLASIPANPPQSHRSAMVLDQDAQWYESPAARQIADNIISYQTPAGGWGKNQDRTASPRVRGQNFVIVENLPANARSGIEGDDDWAFVGTIDNDATTTEIRFLAKVQKAVGGSQRKLYRNAIIKGLNYLLDSQYPNGGWPQVYPLSGGYHDDVTYNDDAITNVLNVLSAVAARYDEYDFVPSSIARRAAEAERKALEMIVKTQVVVHGQRTGWGQQLDPFTLAPVAARNFEPAALASHESATLLTFLMSLPEPSPRVVSAIDDGVSWLQSQSIYDVDWPRGRPAADDGDGRHLTARPGAGPIWARFYDVQTMRPVFGDRDKTVHDDVNDLSRERRNGYSWYGTDPAQTVARFRLWKQQHS